MPLIKRCLSLHRTTLFFALVLLAQWALLFTILTPSWDAGFYYAYARSIAFDGDLHLGNDLLLGYPGAAHDWVANNNHERVTVTGRVHAHFAIGSALFWVPWLAFLRLGAALLPAAAGAPAAFTGYEWWFLGVTAVFSMFMGWCAFYLNWRMLYKLFAPRPAFFTTLTFLFATSLLYYQFREPHYSHTASAFTTTLVVWFWLQRHMKKPSWRSGALIGALIGAASLVRWQHVIYVALPIVSALMWWVAPSAATRFAKWRQGSVYLLAVGLSALVVFSLQLWIWYLFFGSWVTVPQGGAFMLWSALYLRPLLFSTFHGLFTWMPATLPAVVGLVVIGPKNKRLVAPLAVVLLLSIYINASVSDWYGGGGFGPRRFVSELSIFMLGYGALLHWLAGKKPFLGWLGAPMALFFGLHNWILLRYALSDKLGGRILSNYPDYRWADMSLLHFAQQLWGYLPQVVRNPADFFILSGSPLHTMMHAGWRAAIPHLVVLILTALFSIPAAMGLTAYLKRK